MVDEGVCAVFQDEETPSKGSHVEEDIVGVHHWRLLRLDKYRMFLLLSQGLDSVVEVLSLQEVNVVVLGN